MFHAAIPPPAAAAAADISGVGDDLVALAAGLDDRFLSAGTTLAEAIAAIQQVIAALDGVTLAIDDDTATAAIGDLTAIAHRLTALPVTQAQRDVDLADIDHQATAIRNQVIEMRTTLRLLSIYGPNIKIAAGGEPVFLTFVDGMLARLDQGEQHLTQILAELKRLTEGMVGGRQSAQLLLAECHRIVPEVPDRLERSANDLDRYLASLKAVAQQIAAVARAIESRIAVALNALQIGDSTRQRLEHVAAMVAMVAALETDTPADLVPVAAHIHALAAAQTQALAADFERDAERLVAALNDLGGQTQGLLDVIGTHEASDGGHVLTDLDRDVSEISGLTAQLLDADRRAQAMVDITTAAVTALSDRFTGLRLIRRDVQDIAINTRLLCRRFDVMGRAVAVIAVEVGVCANDLDIATRQIGTAMDALSQAGEAIAVAQRHQGMDAASRLALALDAVHAGCGRSERGVREGGDDARALIAKLDTAAHVLTRELAMGSAIRAAGERLALLGNVSPDDRSDTADAALRDLLLRSAALYTMAQERDVHANFLLPGMAIAVAEETDDDGLF